MKTSLSMSAFKYACFISTVATSIFFAAAMEAIVLTEDVAVVGADLNLSGISSRFWPSPPVTIRDFTVMKFPSRSYFSLVIVDENSTLFFVLL